MRKILTALVFSLSTSSFGISAKFRRDCTVLQSPNLAAAPRCSRPIESKVTTLRRSGLTDFYFITSNDCSGYVRKECLGVDRSENLPGTPVTTNREVARAKPFPVKVGIALNIDGLLGKVPYSSDASNGMSYGGSALIKYAMTDQVEAVGGVGYHSMKLSREVSGSASIADSALQVEHKTNYLTGTLAMGYLFNERPSMHLPEPEYWLHGGVQYLFPLGDSQQTGANIEKTFQAEKLLLGLLGPSIDYNLNAETSLFGSLQFFYNLSSFKAPTFYGARIVLAVDFTLG